MHLLSAGQRFRCGNFPHTWSNFSVHYFHGFYSYLICIAMADKPTEYCFFFSNIRGSSHPVN